MTVRVSAGAPIALIELVGPRPASSEIASGRRPRMAVRSGGTATWSYDIRFPVRGVHDLGTIAVRVRDRFGVRTWEHRHVDAKPVRVYPRVTPLPGLPPPCTRAHRSATTSRPRSVRASSPATSVRSRPAIACDR